MATHDIEAPSQPFPILWGGGSYLRQRLFPDLMPNILSIRDPTAEALFPCPPPRKIPAHKPFIASAPYLLGPIFSQGLDRSRDREAIFSRDAAVYWVGLQPAK